MRHSSFERVGDFLKHVVALVFGALCILGGILLHSKSPDWIGDPPDYGVTPSTVPGTIDDPLPRGLVAEFEGYSLRAGPNYADATEYLMTRNIKPLAPEKGWSYVRIPIMIEATGKETIVPIADFDFVAVDSTGTEYATDCPPFLAAVANLGKIEPGSRGRKADVCTSVPTIVLEDLTLLVVDRRDDATLYGTYFDLEFGGYELQW